MIICFLDFGGFSSYNMSLDLIQVEKDLDCVLFHSEGELLSYLHQENPFILFTEFGEVNGQVVEFVSQVRKIRKRISLVNKIPNVSISANAFIELGFDSYYYAKDSQLLLHTIQRERKRFQEKEEREMLLHQLESSYKEIQFQKYAMDQSAVVTISDRDGVISYVNDRFCELTGFKKHEIIGQTHRILNSGYHSKDLWEGFYDTLIRGRVWKGEIRNRKKNGDPLWMEVTVVPFFDSSGKLNKYIAIQFDITFRVLAEERLTRDAFYDPLTNLPNRSYFLAKIEERIGISRLRSDRNLILLVLNIKKFNRVNNMYGYGFGDLVLTEVVSRLNTIVHPKDWILSRLGGDSFGVLISSDSSDDHELKNIACSFQELFHSPFLMLDRSIYLEIGIGIARYGESVKDAEELLKFSELAMFESKKNTSATFQIFESGMMVEIQNRSIIQAQLKQALENLEFIPYYQPIVNSHSGIVEGYEVLMRWLHPSKGLVTPYYFLEIAEEFGLVDAISFQIFRKAFEEFALIRGSFEIDKDLPPLFLSINLSGEQFHESISDTLIENLNANNLDSNCIHIEITENIAMKDLNRTDSILQELSKRGFHISLDDFGTGYSSLSYLKKFTIHHLKIDKSFVDGITKDRKDRIIFETVVNLGKNIGLQVIVEGVESEDQLKIIQASLADSVQGFIYAKPMPFKECLLWTKKNLDSMKSSPRLKEKESL